METTQQETHFKRDDRGNNYNTTSNPQYTSLLPQHSSSIESETMTGTSETSAVSGNDSKKAVLRVAVGSKNPCKVNAVKEAVSLVIGRAKEKVDVELDVQGFSAPSGVPDQPFGDAETQLGAKNRAQSAYTSYEKQYGTPPHLAVGLEGGLEWSSTILDDDGSQTLWCMAWMAIYGERTQFMADLVASDDCKSHDAEKNNGNVPQFGLSKTGSFILPASLGKLIKEGMELGDADDKVFGRVNSKQGSGTVGVLTDGLIDRSGYYEHALVLALVPWIRPDVFQPL